MTNQELIDLALGKIGVVEAGDSANATDSSTALGILNRMMAEWRERSMDFNWFAQDTLGDTVPLPDWAIGGVAANFAVKAASDFRVIVGNELAKEAHDGERTIGNTLISLGLDNADMSHLPQGEGKYNQYDITTE